MKSLFIVILLALSTIVHSQEVDTTQTDSVKCLNTKNVVTGAAAGFILFWQAASEAMPERLTQLLFRKEDTK